MKPIMSTIELHRGSLLLVNARHPLREYHPGRLAAADPRFPEILLQEEAAAALRRLLNRIGAAGRIVPISGYRTQAEQETIYRDSLRENGEAFTRKFVALPGCSEHQTGLAIDLGLNREPIDFICPDFPRDGICGAFRRLAPGYGFVERYPAGKEKITGIAAEPWHFRYVGVPHAQIMTEHRWVLEEYLERLQGPSLSACDADGFWAAALRRRP